MNRRLQTSDQRRYIQSLVGLLEQMQQDPARFCDHLTLIASLRSQGKLCRLTMPDFGLLAVSLNTFKRYCQHHAAGGFDAIDRHRKAALAAIEHFGRNDPTPRKTQKRLIGELQVDNAQLILDNLLLTQLLQVAMRQTRYYAHACGEPNLIALHAKEQRELLDLLSCVRSETRGPKLEKIVYADPAHPDPAVFSRPGS